MLTHTDEYVITGAENSAIMVISIETGEVLHYVDNMHTSAVTTLFLTLDDSILVSGIGGKQHHHHEKKKKKKKNLAINQPINRSSIT